jgi:hypothetical protein
VDWLVGFYSSDNGPYVGIGAGISVTSTYYYLKEDESPKSLRGTGGSDVESIAIVIGNKFGKHFFLEAAYSAPVATDDSKIKISLLPHTLGFAMGVRF